MRKEMQQLMELLAEYGIRIEKRRVSKFVREEAGLLIQTNQTKGILFEEKVSWILSELIRGKVGEGRIIDDFEQFALKTGMDSEKKEMNNFYRNSYYFRYNALEKRIRAYPCRNFSSFKSINHTFESYAAGYADTLNSVNRLEFDFKKTFDRESAMEFLRRKVNNIFELIDEDYEMAEALGELTIKFKTFIALMLEIQIEKQLKKAEKESELAMNA